MGLLQDLPEYQTAGFMCLLHDLPEYQTAGFYGFPPGPSRVSTESLGLSTFDCRTTRFHSCDITCTVSRLVPPTLFIVL